MLQCVAVCCGVLHCVAMFCSVLQCVAVFRSMLLSMRNICLKIGRSTPLHRTKFVRLLRCDCILQCVAVCCSVLKCIAVCCSVLQRVAEYAKYLSEDQDEHTAASDRVREDIKV